MSVPLTLLGLLERGPSHGYDLKRDYDAYFGQGRPLRYSQVYATLSRLARDGKAVAGPVEQGSGPERRRYIITDEGVADVEQWLRRPGAPAAGAPPAERTVRQGRARAHARQARRQLPGRPAGGAPAADARAHRVQAAGRHPRRAARRPLPLPPGGGPAMDRPHGGAAGHDRADSAGAVMTPDHKFIEAVDLSLSFGSTPALRGASLGVAQGEIVAVMGPSGSGKSTLLHCLAGILVPSSGEVHFDGVRLDRLSDDK